MKIYEEEINNIHYYILKNLKYSKNIKKILRIPISNRFSFYLIKKFKLGFRFRVNTLFLDKFNITKQTIYKDSKSSIVEHSSSLKITKSKKINMVYSKPLLSIRFIRLDEPI